jgi:hypothetical protein
MMKLVGHASVTYAYKLRYDSFSESLKPRL